MHLATPNEQVKQQVGAMTHEQLMQLIQAVRTPVKTEKELRDEAQLKTDREAMMETLKNTEAERLRKQRECRHMRRDGSTQTVYVTDLNRLYCQACAKWIYPSGPDAEPELFNTHFQLVL